ncbi:TetR family transcriptional regulator [Aromatoleum toluvorans]|uniref:TetR family transcriptional regulator n=1 Tax=Aromatoleum toluvorans TaxID=92002 RepID=A0ABX1PWN4_9RHOO|nr:TetR/AcrR family transcriptional regulator [Aromatoleum toluvorans]NMG43753.1 TetR family transcriptional regulator [Aromatoleum toluvorans]
MSLDACHGEDRRAPDVEAAILRLARDEPELGQAAVSARLRRDGLAVSPSGVRYIWQKHDLETTVKRLRAIAQASREGVATLTDTQRGLLERGALAAQLVAGDAATDGEPLDRRQVILDAAAALFAEQGYDSTSIRDIASRVGLLPGSIYHYFASKDELYLAVHGEGFRRLMAAVAEALTGASDPWERLTRVCQAHIAAITSGSYIDRVTGHSLAMTGNPELFARIRPMREAYENVYRGLIDALPLAPDVDRSLLRLTVLSVLNWVHVWYREGRRSTDEIAAAVVDMLRRGVESPGVASKPPSSF